jgi:hypothetical protein
MRLQIRLWLFRWLWNQFQPWIDKPSQEDWIAFKITPDTLSVQHFMNSIVMYSLELSVSEDLKIKTEEELVFGLSYRELLEFCPCHDIYTWVELAIGQMSRIRFYDAWQEKSLEYSLEPDWGVNYAELEGLEFCDSPTEVSLLNTEIAQIAQKFKMMGDSLTIEFTSEGLRFSNPTAPNALDRRLTIGLAPRKSNQTDKKVTLIVSNGQTIEGFADRPPVVKNLYVQQTTKVIVDPTYVLFIIRHLDGLYSQWVFYENLPIIIHEPIPNTIAQGQKTYYLAPMAEED